MGLVCHSRSDSCTRQRRTNRLLGLGMGALLLLHSAIAGGNVGALGAGIAAYDAGDYARAFEILDDLALDGNATALAMAGRMYERGQGTEKNLDEALRYYREGAALGSAEAQTSLGHMYLSGNGVPRDEDEGLGWIRHAAEQAPIIVRHLHMPTHLD